MNYEHSWMPDGGRDLVSEDPSGSETFADGCEKLAEGIVWDFFSGTYRGISEARFVRSPEYIEHPTYDGIV